MYRRDRYCTDYVGTHDRFIIACGRLCSKKKQKCVNPNRGTQGTFHGSRGYDSRFARVRFAVLEGTIPGSVATPRFETVRSTVRFVVKKTGKYKGI